MWHLCDIVCGQGLGEEVIQMEECWLSVQHALCSIHGPHKQNVMAHIDNPSALEVEARGSEVQGQL